MYIYLKLSESTFIILVLYADGILLGSNDVGFFHDKKHVLSKTSSEDLSEAFFVLGIEIH